jgi:hypothetical protein
LRTQIRSGRQAASVRRTGFETAIISRVRGRYVAVQGLDRSGAVIGSSAVVLA